MSPARFPTDEANEPTFICTVCWQPQQYPSTPKVLGAEPRIVCHSCWKSVLDLSICWVCGECIVRGDDVVSLGWCFWHRGCFGCLVCGVKMKLSEGENGKGKKGVELEAIPMCDACEDETRNEEESKVLARGLETVSRFDGGLSRDRLDMMSHEGDERRVDRSRWRTSRKFKGSSGLERDLTKFINGHSTSMSDSGIETMNKERALHSIPVDPTSLNERVGILTKCKSSDTMDDEARDIYLSAVEPLGEHAAFELSKTKPLPKWMSLLPSRQQAQRELQKVSGRLTGSSTASEVGAEDFSPTESETGFTAFPKFDYSKLKASPMSPGRETAPIDIPSSSGTRKRSTTISFEGSPAKEYSILRSSSKRNRRCRARSSGSSDPRSYDSKIIPPRRRTPYPDRDGRPILEREMSVESTSCPQSLRLGTFNPTNNTSFETRFPSSVSKKIPSYHPTSFLLVPPYLKDTTSTVHSSEYLDTYHPKECDVRYKKYEPGVIKPIIDKIRRQKVGKQSMNDISEGEQRKRERLRSGEIAMRLGIEEFGIDPRRSDMNRELRHLFNEE